MEYQNNTLFEIIREDTSIILFTKKNKNKKYSSVLIWLAGLEESSEDFLDMFTYNYNLLPHPDQNKIILLCGEKMKITAYALEPNGDELIPSWFDVRSLFAINENNVNLINFDDVKKSTERISKVIEKEVKYLKGYEHIFLGGFSQGACMSIHIGLSYEKKLGGIVCCSGALFPNTIINKNNENVGIFVSHGDLDDQITEDINKLSIKRILHFPNLEFHYYPSIGHYIDQQTLTDLSKFFNKYMK